MEGIKALSETVRRAYAHAKALGYLGSSLEYSMLILPQDMNVMDSGGGYSGSISEAPSVDQLLNNKSY